MKKDENCTILLFRLILIGGILKMLCGAVGSLFTIISFFVTGYLKFSHVFELCDSRKFLTMKQFGNKSEKMITIGKNMDSVAIITNTYIDFSYWTVVYSFICAISILDGFTWSVNFFSFAYFLCTLLLTKSASKWIQETNPKFRGNGFEFKTSLVALCLAFICMCYLRDVGLILVLALFCFILYWISAFYYASLLNSQDVKARYYVSWGFWDKVEENPLEIVLHDGRCFNSREQRFYLLFREDGTMLLYQEKEKKPEIVQRETIAKILCNGEEILL